MTHMSRRGAVDRGMEWSDCPFHRLPLGLALLALHPTRETEEKLQGTNKVSRAASNMDLWMYDLLGHALCCVTLLSTC